MPLDAQAIVGAATLWAQNGDRETPEQAGIDPSVGYGDSFSEAGGEEISMAEWNQFRRGVSGWLRDYVRGVSMIWDDSVAYQHSDTSPKEAAFTMHEGVLWRSTRANENEEPGVTSAWARY